MSDALNWAAALLAGAALGVIFFGGLWWTVQRGAASPSPARWFLLSFVLRTTLVLAGFYLIGAGQLVPLGLCLMGFLVARAIVLVVTRPRPATVPQPSSGVPPCA